jgi:hypothetical protein
MAQSRRKRQTLHNAHLPHNDHELPHAPPPFDPALSAILDHLLCIGEQQMAIAGHQVAIGDHLQVIDVEFSAVKALVEELVP